MFLRKKMKSCKDVNSPQIDTQIQCNSNKNSTSFSFSASWFYIYNWRAKGQEQFNKRLAPSDIGTSEDSAVLMQVSTNKTWEQI